MLLKQIHKPNLQLPQKNKKKTVKKKISFFFTHKYCSIYLFQKKYVFITILKIKSVVSNPGNDCWVSFPQSVGRYFLKIKSGMENRKKRKSSQNSQRKSKKKLNRALMLSGLLLYVYVIVLSSYSETFHHGK